jgi:glucose-6-phosphate-specific signal transduction histidine kinase
VRAAEIRDDGIGGADRAWSPGLTGLSDRIGAVGGTLDVTSPAAQGTALLIEIRSSTASGNRTSQLALPGDGRWP